MIHTDDIHPPDLHLPAHKGEHQCQNLLDVRGDGHGQGADLLVGREADEVQSEGDNAVRREYGANSRVDVAFEKSELSASSDFAIQVRNCQSLQHCEGGHAVKEFQSVQVQPGGLEAVGCDSLYGSENGTEEGHDKSSDRGIVVSVRCETDADDDRDK